MAARLPIEAQRFFWDTDSAQLDVDEYPVYVLERLLEYGDLPSVRWMQHPETELYSTSIHARSGVACADCHMPYVRDGAVKVSDHWLRSPLTNINKACQTCHKQDEQELKDRVALIQNRTAELERSTEKALLDAMDAVKAAKAAGASDDALNAARQLHRRASMRYDFVMSENSTGFHSPQEAARIPANSVDFARQARIAAIQATQKK